MNLRKELTAGGSCAGFTSEEKDPEEFLNVIMQHVLGLEPLLKLSPLNFFSMCVGPKVRGLSCTAPGSQMVLVGTITVYSTLAVMPSENVMEVVVRKVLSEEPWSAGHKDQECYCHQIFIDQDDDLTVPTVQQLVEHSFHSNQLKLAE
eukprot:g38428.t1